MTFTNFIKRPVLSTVISILIVLLGFIGLVSLPIEQYPNIAPPNIMVIASYPGTVWKVWTLSPLPLRRVRP